MPFTSSSSDESGYLEHIKVEKTKSFPLDKCQTEIYGKSDLENSTLPNLQYVQLPDSSLLILPNSFFNPIFFDKAIRSS
jgi:hypothetical protein